MRERKKPKPAFRVCLVLQQQDEAGRFQHLAIKRIGKGYATQEEAQAAFDATLAQLKLPATTVPE
jgi:hypothetical protein